MIVQMFQIWLLIWNHTAWCSLRKNQVNYDLSSMQSFCKCSHLSYNIEKSLLVFCWVCVHTNLSLYFVEVYYWLCCMNHKTTNKTNASIYHKRKAQYYSCWSAKWLTFLVILHSQVFLIMDETHISISNLIFRMHKQSSRNSRDHAISMA